MLVLRGLVGLHRTVQLQLLQHYWLGHRLAAAAAAESLQSCPTLCDTTFPDAINACGLCSRIA